MSNRPTRQPMASIVREAQHAAATRPTEPPRAGLRPDGSLVDRDGHIYVQTDQSIGEDRAFELAAAGAVVVWDSCGCGGGCALDWYTADQVARMVASGPPSIARTKRKRGAISEWRAQDGSVLLLAEVAVRWADLLS